MSETNIVIVGAGVVGLTSALLLSKNPAYNVTVVARHLPGDYHIAYCSPWAGANLMPMSAAPGSRYEKETWPELQKLAANDVSAGIHFQKTHVFRRSKDLGPDGKVLYDSLFDVDPWFRSLFTDFRDLTPSELPSGHSSGCEFGSVCINPLIYLPWLQSKCLANGVIFKRGTLDHLGQAAGFSAFPGTPIVVNATGLSSLTLGGVLDNTLYPARGQTVLVANECTPMMVSSGVDGPEADCFYLMQRAAGGGTILGGTYDANNWDANPDPNIALRIMERAIELAPGLTNGKGVAGLQVIKHGVGLRPVRKGGIRLERETMEYEGKKLDIVHNYGHGGYGYQTSYGCANHVVELVAEIVAEAK